MVKHSQPEVNFLCWTFKKSGKTNTVVISGKIMATSEENSDLVNLPDDIKAIIKDGKNAKALKCQRCPSLILKAESGKFVRNDVSSHSSIFLQHI